MKNNLLKLLSLALVSLLLLAACGGGGATPATPSQGGTAAPAEAGADGMVGNMYVTGLPIVKEKESFSILIDSTGDPESMDLFKQMEEETNVKVEWLVYPNDIATEKKNLMYSSGDYPDCVGGWLLKEIDINKYALNEGVFIPIQDLVESYAPRMTYVFDNFPEARRSITAPDGKIYTVPLLAPQPITRFVMHINTTWLDKLNLPMPKTTDELYTTLKAFKEQDPNGNGKADEIPLSISMAASGSNIGRIYGWFGLPDETIHIQMLNGKPTFTATTEGYKDATKYFEKLFSEGLLDPELFTHDSAQYNAKGKTPDELYGAYEDWSGSNVVGWERYVEDYSALPVLASPNGNPPTFRQGDSWVFKTQFAITSDAKNPATIIRWLDNIYEEENSVKIMMGSVYQLESDGTYSYVKPPEGETVDTMRDRSTIWNLPYAIMPDVYENKFPKDETRILKDKIDALYEPDIISEKMPNFWLTDEESAEVSIMQTDIDKFVKDKRAAWITGQGDIDAEWDSYLAQLDTLGLQKYMEIYTTAIMRTLEN